MLIIHKLFPSLLFCFFTWSLSSQRQVEQFLPDFFSSYSNVRDIAIAPSGEEIYFTLDSYKSEIGSIAYIQKQKAGWSKPEIVSFSGNYRDLEPAFSADGKTLYFSSNRPVHKDSIAVGNYNIWKINREEDGWSSVMVLGPEVNTEHNEFYPSVAANGNLYFTSDRPTEIGRENIYVSDYDNGLLKKAIPLGKGVNSKYYEFNAFVAPDESFLLFSAIRPNEGMGGGDLYISLNENGWQKAQPLNLVNTPFLDFCPFVDVKTGQLYFTSQKTEIKSSYGNPLRADFFSDLKDSKLPKGLNRIYTIDFQKTLPKK
ncbi:PD40 domain-containing protein [Flagellimonas sp. CMM7]|uniref:TolB family protein n=1 Tax=Flagellimonas sp. CMM7 TaxID=2654676 RepID=UPI0013D6B6A6|nr:PD40 domain-containing protein [Flagellimonas sp. CMM7]UII81419.1 PD40 domain-containing protein [Flagellimonas sp. CMM7]